MKEKFKILIVDDDENARKLHRKILEKNTGYSIEEAENGREALTRIENWMPDIILSDLYMPVMDGLELCKRLRQDETSPLAGIYVIMISAEKKAENRRRCMKEGADDYLTKPVEPNELLARIKVGQRISLLLKRTEMISERMFENMDVLLIQDGGCAPGYNPVTAFITYHLEAMGRNVFATLEGFKSLATGTNDDFVRLVYDPVLFKKMDHIPGVFHAAPLSESRGAQLRSERYKDFLKNSVQKQAAALLKKKKVRAIIAIGGNGTFRGIHSLCEYLPTGIQVFFIPVTIDSDVADTDCIGQYTGVEMGAERVRCFMADARTHKRTYIVEMMGANSGFHALHSCLGARAHLAVLPVSKIDHKKVAEALNLREECVIVVAEGYKKEERQARGIEKNAAEYFYEELLATGVEIKRKVVCEPFSRDIRGAAPNNLDISLAQRMAYNVANYLKEGTSRLMPAVQSGREYAIPFNEIRTDNMKEEALLVLADRITNR